MHLLLDGPEMVEKSNFLDCVLSKKMMPYSKKVEFLTAESSFQEPVDRRKGNGHKSSSSSCLVDMNKFKPNLRTVGCKASLFQALYFRCVCNSRRGCLSKFSKSGRSLPNSQNNPKTRILVVNRTHTPKSTRKNNSGMQKTHFVCQTTIGRATASVLAILKIAHGSNFGE